MNQSDFSLDFAIEEYKAIRAEILDRSRLDQQLQRNGNLSIIAALGLYYSNTFNMDNPLIILASSIIAFYTLLTQARFKQYGVRLGTYVKMIEEKVYESGSEVNLGWERQLSSIRDGETKEPLEITGSIVKVVRGQGYALSSTELDRTYWKVVSGGLFLLFLWECIGFLMGK